MLTRWVLVLILCLLSASQSWAAATLDNCTLLAVESATANHDTTQHTVASGATDLFVFVGADGDLDVSNFGDPTWDFGGSAQAMTAVVDNGSVGLVAGKAWKLANPTAGNKTLRVIWNGGNDCCAIGVCSFTSGGTVGTPAETESTGTVAGDSLAFTGDIAVGFLMTQAALTNFTQGADQTQRQRLANTTCAGGSSSCDATLTTATVSPIDYTWNSTGTDFWHVVIPLSTAVSTRRPIPPIFQ